MKFPLAPNTASFWLTLAGAAIPGQAGAYLWLLCGYGWLGVAWQRASNARLSREIDLTKGFTTQGVLTHMPQLILGMARLSRR